MATVCDQAVHEGFSLVATGLDQLADAGVQPASGADAARLIEAAETLRRRFDALQVDLLSAIDETQAHHDDGHFSARRMVEHVGRVAPREARERERLARMGAALPHIAAALRAGSLGSDQARLLARVHANTRVRDFMTDAQQWFLEQAQSLSFRDFEQVVREWERLADADGARDRNQRNHENRDAKVVQDPFDLGFEVRGNWAALSGSMIKDIHNAYTRAEYEADWEKARAEHGDAATVAHLPRTAAQRRADAFSKIFEDAANSGSTLGSAPVHNVVWSADSFEQMIASLDTGRRPSLHIDTHRCSTIDGVPLEPAEAAVSSLLSQLRRVVVDAAGVVIDLGRARCFTGSARHAALLNSPACIWPGCHKPTSECEVDHLTEHSRGGRTNPGNGAPLCGRHNRHKQNHRYTVSRDLGGTYTVTRPDGTVLR